MISELDPEITHTRFVELKQRDTPSIRKLGSIFEARKTLRQINLGWLERTYAKQADHSFFVQRLQQWKCAFAEFVFDNKRTFDSADRQSVAQLEMARRYTELVMSVAAFHRTQEDTQWWDSQCPLMEEIVNYGAAAAKANEDGDNQTPVVAFDSGVNVVLYTMAVWCRDPRIRRKAIWVLRSTNRQEGFWNGKMAADFAEKHVVLPEEHGRNVRSCSDVPAEARLEVLRVDLQDREAKALLRHVAKPEKVRVVPVWGDSSPLPAHRDSAAPSPTPSTGVSEPLYHASWMTRQIEQEPERIGDTR